MRPPDAIIGWDDELNAELYGRFTRDFPFYTDTSRDLVNRADLSGARTAVDLCGGTGITAAVLLESLGPQGQVISVDKAAAMQRIGKRDHDDPRITWITAGAEDAAAHIPDPVDAVVCNSAIWKTDIPAAFASVKTILQPGGRFVFNIGGGFAGLSKHEDRPNRPTPSLNDLIIAIAVADYGYQPHQEKNSAPVLTAADVSAHLEAAGFSVLETEAVSHQGTVEEKRAWLSIPLFARPPGQLTYEQRMEILQKAYDAADKTQPITTRWLVVTAEA